MNIVVYAQTNVEAPDGSKLLVQLIGVNDVFTCITAQGVPLIHTGDLIIWKNKQYKVIARQFTYEMEGNLVGLDYVVEPQEVKR